MAGSKQYHGEEFSCGRRKETDVSGTWSLYRAVEEVLDMTQGQKDGKQYARHEERQI